MGKATTKGGIVLEDIKVGDIHYEFEYGMGIKCEVVTKPERTQREDGDFSWEWESKNLNTGQPISYYITEGFTHYGPNLYDYEAYTVTRYI